MHNLLATDVFGQSSFVSKYRQVKIILPAVMYLTGINFRGFCSFWQSSRKFVPAKMSFWKILSFLGNFGDFCSISMANTRKYIPAKYGHFYHRENKYPRKLIPIRHKMLQSVKWRVLIFDNVKMTENISWLCYLDWAIPCY